MTEFKTGDVVDVVDLRDGTVIETGATILGITVDQIPHAIHGTARKAMASLSVGYGVPVRCLRRSESA
jgi:hypothetical protein